LDREADRRFPEARAKPVAAEDKDNTKVLRGAPRGYKAARRAYGSILTGFVTYEGHDSRSHVAVVVRALRQAQNYERNMETEISSIITPEIKAELLSRSADFEDAIQKVFAPWQVVFEPGKSLSKMVKDSPLYQSKTKEGQTAFFNEIKSLCRAHKIGERLTVEAIIRGYWARFNGTTKYAKGEKAGQVKTLNIAFVDSEVKASKEDERVVGGLEKKRLEEQNAKLLEDKSKSEAENARLQARVMELEAEVINGPAE
jgi:hypothetical protein